MIPDSWLGITKGEFLYGDIHIYIYITELLQLYMGNSGLYMALQTRPASGSRLCAGVQGAANIKKGKSPTSEETTEMPV